MTTYRQRQRALRRLIIIALTSTLIFSWLLWYSATAQTNNHLYLPFVAEPGVVSSVACPPDCE